MKRDEDEKLLGVYHEGRVQAEGAAAFAIFAASRASKHLTRGKRRNSSSSRSWIDSIYILKLSKL
jgi:hypothetical protein